jgi:thioredoxin reductase (NADPH)
MIALVGAGPLGLEIAVALKRNKLAYLHWEGGQIGSTMAWWAPGTRWFSSSERIAIAGVPLETPQQEKATREEYLAYLRGIVQQFDLNVRTYRQVNGIRRTGPGERNESGELMTHGFSLSVKHALHDDLPEESINVDKIILAVGGTATPNLLQIPGESLPQVSHYFRDPHAYFRQRLLIVGGRNSAVEAALRCYRAGARVTVCYRGAAIDAKDIKYWLYPEFSGLVKAGHIRGIFGATVEEITPAEVRFKAHDGTRSSLPFDFVLLLTGYRADTSLMKMAGIELAGEQEIPSYDPATMETNVPGVYVAGTAIAGTQRRYKVFLENCHVHVDRIIAHLLGKTPPRETIAGEVLERPES